MKQERNAVRLNLTPEQREMVRKATGKSAESLELTVQG